MHADATPPETDLCHCSHCCDLLLCRHLCARDCVPHLQPTAGCQRLPHPQMTSASTPGVLPRLSCSFLSALSKLKPRSRPSAEQLRGATKDVERLLQTGHWSNDLASSVPRFIRSHSSWIRGVNAFDKDGSSPIAYLACVQPAFK